MTRQHIKARAIVLATIMILSVMAMGVAFSGTAVADTLSVDDDGTADYDTIQAAINDASSGDTIEVESGTYGDFIVNKSVTIVGVGDVTIESSQVDVTADGAEISNLLFTGDYSDWRNDPANNLPPAHVDSPPGSVFYPILWVNADGVVVDSIEIRIDSNSDWSSATTGMVISGDSSIVNSNLQVPEDDGFHGQPVLELVDGADVNIQENEFSRNIGGFVGAGQEVIVEDNSFTGAVKNFGFTGPGFGPIPASATISVSGNEMAYVQPQDHVNGWFFASHNINSVIGATADGGTVNVNPGTYSGVQISKNVSLVGVEGPSETTIEGGSDNAILLTGHTDELDAIEVRGLTLQSDDGAGLIAFSDGNTDFDTTNLVVSNVVVEDSAFGIYFFDAKSVEISDSEIRGVDGAAVAMAGVEDVTIAGNNIRDNGAGVSVGVGNPTSNYPDNNDVRVKENNIAGNEVGVFNGDANLTVDGTNNWWGHASGPGGDDGRTNPAGKEVGKGDDIDGDVDFDPWLRQPVDA